jgi:hypothetical protein
MSNAGERSAQHTVSAETARRFLSLLSTNEEDVHQALKDLEVGCEITAERPVLIAILRGFMDSSPVVAGQGTP